MDNRVVLQLKRSLIDFGDEALRDRLGKSHPAVASPSLSISRDKGTREREHKV